MLHYHGTPITPRATLLTLSGRSFCVSFARPDNVKVCHEIGQSVMLDNGAFSFWRRGAETDWEGYYDWCEKWLVFNTSWAVIPDVIGGSELENNVLLSHWRLRGLPRGAPVWHMHESLDRLRRLVHSYERVCFGSSGEYKTVGTPDWRRRCDEAFNAIVRENGSVPWIHMLRGMSLSGKEYPFSSVDSTDIARNHNRPQNTASGMAHRWDSMQAPAVWTPRYSLEPFSAELDAAA